MKTILALAAVGFLGCYHSTRGEVTPEWTDRFNKAANGKEILQKEAFDDFITQMWAFATPTSGSQARLKAALAVFSGEVSLEEAKDFCRVNADFLSHIYFNGVHPIAEMRGTRLKPLFEECEGHVEDNLTLAGLQKFVSKAFKGISEKSVVTWHKILTTGPPLYFNKVTLQRLRDVGRYNTDIMKDEYLNFDI